MNHSALLSFLAISQNSLLRLLTTIPIAVKIGHAICWYILFPAHFQCSTLGICRWGANSYRSWSIIMVEHSMQHETMHGDHCTGLVKISLDNTIRSPTVVQSNFNCQLKSLPINTQDCQEFLLGHPQRNCYAFWTRANHQELKPQIFLILYLSLLRIKTNNLVFTRYSSPNSYLFQNPVWMQQELIMRQ